MESEKILKLFKKFIGDKLNIHGLIAVPIKVEQLNSRSINIDFKMFNPDDVSYFLPLVEDYILDETDEFGELINKKIGVYFVPDFKNGLYLSEELTSRIQKVFNSVKVIEFDDDDELEEEEIIDLDEDILISFLNEYYEINPKSLPKPEFY